MTIVIMASKKIFNNPNKIAVESLELSVNNDGVVRSVRAIDPAWVTKRELAVFSPAPSGPTVAIGELKAWQENTQCFLDDLKWLLTLEYHKFWSHIVYYPPCMDMVVSFLQEAYPPYLPPHPDNAVMDLYSEAYKKVLTIFSRLVTNKESEIEWMSASYLGKLIYDKFIFTIPIIFDLCLLYGTNNSSHISKLIKTIFQLQPKYNDDLTTALTFLKQIFSFIALQIDNRNNMDVVPPTLPGIFKGFSQSFGGLRSQVTAVKTLSLTSLHDLALHLVDCAVTLRLFLEVYPPSRQVLRENEFYASIVNLYENTLPFMYEKVVELGDPKKEPYNEIFNQLDLIRAEFIDIYRFIIVTTIDDILSGGPNVENSVNSFLTIITDSLSEKYFIKDYNSLHPVEVDLDVLCQAYDQMDLVKYDFIIQAIITTCYDDDDGAIPPTTKQNGGITNGHQEEALPVELLDNLTIEPIQGSDIPQEAKTQSLISEVKDILPHLGDGFILKCLEHLNFNSERVINSVLEGTLDESLQALDPSLPIIPQDALDTQYLETGIDRLNVFDNDEFDVMTRDNIDLSKVHKGKRKPKHKNLSEMLNDKSHVKEMKDTYTKYSLVSDDVDMYEDEYDDTYDGDAPVLVNDGNAEADKKLLFKRAPLRESGECLAESEDSDDEPGPSGNTQPKDSFCVNPEEVRARYQAMRDAKYGNKHPQRDVVGKAKGQGQDKDVLISRQKKAANKSQSGNHNRRSGAQWKRNQGVLPS